MKQNNPPKNDLARANNSEQNTVSEQIRGAKAKMLENARIRSEQRAGRKSMGAVTATPAQSEITDKAPQLYTPTKINVPADFGEVARLLFRELNNISQSQSYILTLWEKVKGQIADNTGITFTLPVNFTGGLSIDGLTGFNALQHNIPTIGDSFDSAPWGWAYFGNSYPDSPNGGTMYGTCLTICSQGTEGYATPKAMEGINGLWVQQIAISTDAGLSIRTRTNEAAWSAWKNFSVAESS